MTRKVTKKSPRSKVAHDAQKPDAHAIKDDEQRQVPLVEQPLQRGRSGEDIADLDDLRGLEAEAADGDPVDRAVLGGGRRPE